MGETLALQLPGAYPRWFDADNIEVIAAERTVALEEAADIYEHRMQHLRQGEYDQVPHEVDPLTTATRVVQAEQQYGQDSEHYRQARHSLYVDSQRLLGEAWRRGTWEYFPPIEQPYDETEQSYTFMGRSLLDMVTAGITPTITQKTERDNRRSEFVEERTYKAIRSVGRLGLSSCLEVFGDTPATKQPPELQPGVAVNTISECADWAIEAYEQGERQELGGYVPELQKMMVRGVRYDAERDVRLQEQMMIPGIHITHDVVVETMRRLQVAGADETLTKEEVRAKQLIDPQGKGVIEIVKLLDAVASENGKNVFLGEEVATDDPKDYDSIPVQAMERQRELEDSTEELTEYLINLEKEGADHFVARGLVENRAHDLLFKKVEQDPVQAAVVFDQQTADLVQQSVNRREMGDDLGARELLLRAKELAPALAFCGAGSECGLEKVDTYSAAAIKARSLGLEVDADEEILHDTKRVCVACGEKEIYYASLTARKVCTACGKKDTAGKARVAA